MIQRDVAPGSRFGGTALGTLGSVNRLFSALQSVVPRTGCEWHSLLSKAPEFPPVQ